MKENPKIMDAVKESDEAKKKGIKTWELIEKNQMKEKAK